MKYCISYSNKSHIIDEVDEILIKYDKNKILELFTQFIPQHQTQRVIVEVGGNEVLKDETLIDQLNKIIKIHKENLDLKFDLCISRYDKKITDILKETDLKYFFQIHANNWDTFTGLVNLGVSDIYVTENLAFELDKVAEIAHKKNIKIRTYPNVAQSRWEELEDIYKFFIRPEDIEVYEDYVDVCEFYGLAKEVDTFYKIYAKDKKWFGDLKEIIIGLNNSLDSRYIIPRFALNRIKCGKKCLKDSKCQICNRILDLSENLKEAKLIVQIDKDKEDNNGKGTESKKNN